MSDCQKGTGGEKYLFVTFQQEAAEECHCERSEAISPWGLLFPLNAGLMLLAMTNTRLPN
jgi:hypothetical protein